MANFTQPAQAKNKVSKPTSLSLKTKFLGTFLTRVGILSFVAFSLIFSILLFGLSYESFTEIIFGSYGQPEKLSKFRETLFTPNRFVALRYGAVAFTILWFTFTFYSWRRIPRIIEKISDAINRIYLTVRRIVNQTSRTERLLIGSLFLLTFGTRLYFAFQFPLHIDERFTYLYFVSKGWAVSAAYYPNPNNHILFSLLCNLARLFSDSPLWALRVPALLTGMAAVVGFWLAARYYFSASIAGFATTLLAFSPPVFGYGFQGRGYSLMLCWVIAAAAMVLKIVSSENTKPAYFLLYIVCSVLGFYTIPIFLYPFAGMSLYLFLYFSYKKDIRSLRQILAITVFIALGVGFLYLPVFLLNGWNAVAGNSWVAPMAWSEFSKTILPNLIDSSRFLWNEVAIAPYIVFIVSFLCISTAISHRTDAVQKHWLLLFVCCLWAAVSIIFWQRITLYTRLWLYVFPLQWMAIAILIGRFRSFKRYYFGIILFVAGFQLFNCLAEFQKANETQQNTIYHSFDGVANYLYQHEADFIYVQYYEYGLCILFQYETNHRSVELAIGAERLYWRKNYTFVVVHKSHPFPALLKLTDYQLVYTDTEAKIYKRLSL